MQMFIPSAQASAGLVFQGTPNELFAMYQLLLKASKNGGEISDLDMIFLNTMIDNAKKDGKQNG